MNTKSSTNLQKLRRARQTLRNIEKYCNLQKRCAKDNLISPGTTWQKVYGDVNGMIEDWCKNALKESK